MDGAQEAFSNAYREHLGWMLNTVRRLGITPGEQEDVAHDVFSTAWKRLDTWQPSRPMRPWLFGIAFRIVANRKTNKSRTEVVASSEALPEQAGAVRPDEVLESEVTRAHISSALEALPLEQRALFVGHDIEQTPINELAAALEVPLNTAYSRLRLARQKFQSTFDALQRGAEVTS